LAQGNLITTLIGAESVPTKSESYTLI